jgi:hypothetical protein
METKIRGLIHSFSEVLREIIVPKKIKGLSEVELNMYIFAFRDMLLEELGLKQEEIEPKEELDIEKLEKIWEEGKYMILNNVNITKFVKEKDSTKIKIGTLKFQNKQTNKIENRVDKNGKPIEIMYMQLWKGKFKDFTLEIIKYRVKKTSEKTFDVDLTLKDGYKHKISKRSIKKPEEWKEKGTPEFFWENQYVTPKELFNSLADESEIIIDDEDEFDGLI